MSTVKPEGALIVVNISLKYAKCHAMTPDRPRDTRNLCSKTFPTHPWSQLLALWKERSSNRRSQQRLSRSKKGRTWSLQRSPRHEINKFRDALMRKNVAYDVMKNKCHDGNVSNACPRSQCTRAHRPSAPWRRECVRFYVRFFWKVRTSHVWF